MHPLPHGWALSEALLTVRRRNKGAAARGPSCIRQLVAGDVHAAGRSYARRGTFAINRG